MWKPSARLLGAAVVVLALVAVPNLSASAAPAALVRDDYPTWDEVNAAKANAATKQAEVDNIRSLLSNLQDAAAAAQNEAFQRGQEYLSATYDLQAATAYADTLASQAAEATAKADTANAQVGQLAAQLYRSGGDSTINLILNQNDSDSLLYQLGTMSKLTEQTAGIRDIAVAAQNTADALNDQADIAKAQRDELAQAAKASLDAATAAQEKADADAARAEVQKDQLTAQLASLNDTTQEIEQEYQKGVEYRAQQAAAEAAARASSAAAAAAADAPGSAWVPDAGSVASPAEAKAIAAGLMGSYGWGGGQYDCLVQLWIGESGWRVNAYNDSSGAYGIPQSLPASKMASVGADFVTNATTQIIWGMNYIADRYDTPCGALSAWEARSPHWY
jgi:septal ring factor EnvC (AmiA/AmiB activator)